MRRQYVVGLLIYLRFCDFLFLLLQWPGYEEFHYEFRILDRKLGRLVPITMSRLVERVMRGIHRLFLVSRKKRHFSSFLVILTKVNGLFSDILRMICHSSSGRQARPEFIQRAMETGGWWDPT